MPRIMVVITSGGKNWVGLPPEQEGKMHGIRIIQIPVDAEEIIPKDPVGELPDLDGRYPEIKKAILKPEIRTWLDKKRAEISKSILDLWIKNGLKEDVIIHIAVRCTGGFQRSVVFAEYLFEELQRMWQTDYEEVSNCPRCEFALHHLTLPIAQIVKGWVKEKDGLLIPFSHPLTKVSVF